MNRMLCRMIVPGIGIILGSIRSCDGEFFAVVSVWAFLGPSLNRSYVIIIMNSVSYLIYKVNIIQINAFNLL